MTSENINKSNDDIAGVWIEIDKDMYACSICSHCISIVPEDNRIEQLEYCPFCGKPMKTELKQKDELLQQVRCVSESHGFPYRGDEEERPCPCGAFGEACMTCPWE